MTFDSAIKNILLIMLVTFSLLVIFSSYTGRNVFEWTFDGAHHVLKVGK